jgi:hypothetical protein
LSALSTKLTRNSSLTRVRPVFGAALDANVSGMGWLPTLLARAPAGNRLDPDIRRDPGELLGACTAHRSYTDRVLGRTVQLRACFEYPALAPERFLRWCLDHPERLDWPSGSAGRFSAEATRWRRALFHDEPPGSAVARREGHDELTRLGVAGSHRRWWVFEGTTSIDCLLMTDRLVLAIEGKRTDRLAPSTSWYPLRSQLVRNLEAAGDLARGRAFATLLVTEEPDPDGEWDAVAASLDDAAPHLDDRDRAALQQAYLGQLTWAHVCDALGVEYDSLPDTLDVPAPARGRTGAVVAEPGDTGQERM